jgi:hypothetical protein
MGVHDFRSQWKPAGSAAISIATSGVIGRMRTVRGSAAICSHSSKGMLKRILGQAAGVREL